MLSFFNESNAPGMLVAVLSSEGRIESCPQREFLEGAEPEKLCWDQRGYDDLQIAMFRAGMRREVVKEFPVSFRIVDRCEEFVLTLRPINDRGAICFFFTDRRRELTKAERAVLKLVIEGHTNQAIGEKLNIEPPSVTRHLHNMGQRLNVQRPEQLIAAAHGYKFHPPEK